ncbi:hypothetical protein [Thermaerobacillus caldiproteolyticus]|uniref:hypothetical protein n=1 Tax=Thermaerobacillus caldiproteolyticus TaxID=247480 RepID=UPI00188A6CF3|nr:hypothetical protein [Anoxybacillus caldiproteolyticus]QPA31579.1 hypothetical protein ISX45_00695 [Anoxybacillus caldiproteolyticus]
MNSLKNINLVKIISFIISVIGLFLILKSPELGQSSAWAREAGGSVKSDEWMQMLHAYTTSYRAVGIIFLSIGLFYVLKKE